jgi:Uma2 family endonuclease
MTAEGEIVVMPPNYTLTSIRNPEIGNQPIRWADRDRGGTVADSSGGFVLPNGPRRSPDASWIAKSQFHQMTEESARLAWLIDPDSRTVEVYRPNREPELLAGAESIAAGDPVNGFVLDLRAVWDPLAK